MTSAPVNRPLNDDERTLLRQLAIQVVAQQMGRDPGAVADELDKMTIVVRGDAHDAYLEADGKVLVHATREWLAFHSAYPGDEPLRGTPIEPGDE